MINLKIGIIGAGGIATGRHIPAFKEIEASQFMAFLMLITFEHKKSLLRFRLSLLLSRKNSC
ncbi:hypothetical protein JCM19045_1484 [Bacillus sp. JCM 19045]|nr:hypothetical protein JCM19045_1484 [Bacillus sp. JCM 19045]